jgi:hypothetical protein
MLTAFSIGSTLLGCAPSLQPGLANAPRLGGTGLTDERMRDVIANGDDACSRQAEHGLLSNRIPPCPPAVGPAIGTEFSAKAATNDSLVLPWLRHFYTGWPCAHPALLPAAKTKTIAATAIATAPRQPLASCGAP